MDTNGSADSDRDDSTPPPRPNGFVERSARYGTSSLLRCERRRAESSSADSEGRARTLFKVKRSVHRIASAVDGTREQV